MSIQKFLRRAFWSLIALSISSIVLLIVFLENGSGIYLSNNTKRTVSFEVRSAPELPTNFLTFYNKAYPGSLETGVWDWTFSNFISQSGNTRCPCATMAYSPLLYKRQPEGVGRIVAHLSVALQFEEIFTQTECLNYLTHSHDFLRNVEGIHAASKFYLKKELHELNEIEMAELIARMENPLYYDREKNPWNLDRKINLLLKQTNYAE